MRPPYRSHVVGFLDILGFKEHVLALPKDRKLFERLHYALRRIKWTSLKPKGIKSTSSNLEFTIFSDSIIISSKKRHLSSLIWSIGWIQADLLKVGVLTRGGIAYGPIVHEDGILYGAGFLSAHHLESKAAVYPRTIVDANLYKAQLSAFLPWTEVDQDGLVFIDYFRFKATVGDDEMAADGYDLRAEYFKEVQRYILEGVKMSSQPDHKAKWHWVANRYNISVKKFNKTSLEKINLIKLAA